MIESVKNKQLRKEGNQPKEEKLIKRELEVDANKLNSK
jgi:hypothetical protein